MGNKTVAHKHQMQAALWMHCPFCLALQNAKEGCPE